MMRGICGIDSVPLVWGVLLWASMRLSCSPLSRCAPLLRQPARVPGLKRLGYKGIIPLGLGNRSVEQCCNQAQSSIQRYRPTSY